MTLSGLGAVLIWSFTGVIGGNVTHIPIYQFLFWSHIVVLISLGGMITIKKQWKRVISQPLWFWIGATLTLGINQLSYIMAFRYAPPEQVDLINYQWPMLLALAVSLLPGKRFHWTTLAGCLLGMLGVWWMFAGGGSSLDLHGPALIGSLWAALGALAWIAYCVLSHFNAKAPAEAIVVPIAICTPFYAILQALGPTAAIVLSWADIGWTVAWGLGCYAVAFVLWDTSVRRGNFAALSLISYLTPIGSIALLVVFGLAPGSVSLAIATGMIILGSLTGGYGRVLFSRKTAKEKLEKGEKKELLAA